MVQFLINVLQTVMSSESIYEAIDNENWETVRALLAIKPSLSREELEIRYGVHSTYLQESFLLSVRL